MRHRGVFRLGASFGNRGKRRSPEVAVCRERVPQPWIATTLKTHAIFSLDINEIPR